MIIKWQKSWGRNFYFSTEIKEEYSGSEVTQTQIIEDFASEGYSNYEDENFDIASQSSENVYSYSDNQDVKFNYDLAKSSKQWMIKYNKNTTSSNH